MQVEFTENLEFAWCVLYKRNDSAFPNGCLHNHCNVAPVRAPRSLTFKASNGGVRNKFLRLLIRFNAYHVTVIIESVSLCGIIFMQQLYFSTFHFVSSFSVQVTKRECYLSI